MNQVKLGIIGLGNMGSGHCNNILAGLTPEIKLTAAADLRQSRRDWAKETLPDDVVLFENGDQLIESGLCDAVIIATPHYEHPRLAILAFEHGLHVMSEKPAGVYTKQVREMNEAAIRSGKVFGMMFNQRTNCVYKKMHEMVQSGKYGQIKRVNWIITDWYRTQAYYNSGGWRATWDGEGGGVLLNQNPHNLDLWQWMCGIPKRVKSQVYYGKHRNIEVEDDLYALVEYENGATGCYITTVGDAPGTNRLEIDGTNGKIVVENNELTFYRLRIPEPEFNATYKGGLGKPEVWECKIPIKGTYTSHPGIINNFCDCILKGAKPIAPGAEGIRGLQISNAIHLSSWLNGEWVDIPVNGDLFLEKLQEHCKEPVTK